MGYNNKTMELIELIEENFTFGFTGRINILYSKNNQYLGAVFLKDGVIVSAEYKDDIGSKALFNIVYDAQKQSKFHFISEPEIISDSHSHCSYDRSGFYDAMKHFIGEIEKSKKLRPPDDLTLAINRDFIIKGEDVTSDEFDILSLISDYGKVLELYKHSKLYDYQITNILISLRRKKAVRVI